MSSFWGAAEEAQREDTSTFVSFGGSPMQHVGQGQGSYEVVEQLVWVGPGKGNFNLEESPPPVINKDDCLNSPEAVARGEGYFRRGAFCKAFYKAGVAMIVGLLMLGCVCLAISFAFPGALEPLFADSGKATQRRTANAQSDTPRPEVATNLSMSDAQRMRRSLCEDVAALSNKNATASALHGSTRIQGISEQLDWCCKHEQIGCQEFNCDEDAATWQMSWSGLKKKWCCEHYSRGCQEAAG